MSEVTNSSQGEINSSENTKNFNEPIRLFRKMSVPELELFVIKGIVEGKGRWSKIASNTATYNDSGELYFSPEKFVEITENGASTPMSISVDERVAIWDSGVPARGQDILVEFQTLEKPDEEVAGLYVITDNNGRRREALVKEYKYATYSNLNFSIQRIWEITDNGPLLVFGGTDKEQNFYDIIMQLKEKHNVKVVEISKKGEIEDKKRLNDFVNSFSKQSLSGEEDNEFVWPYTEYDDISNQK